MVRLKDFTEEEEKEIEEISIPYGAIKRIDFADQTKFTAISIPYGAIKS